MDRQIKLGIQLTFLKTRFIIILIFLIVFLRKLSLNYKYYVNKFLSSLYVYPHFDLRGKYEFINNFLQNFSILLDGKFNLLVDSFLLTILFVISIFIIKIVVDYLFKEREYKRKEVTLSTISIWSFIYFLIIIKFSLTVTILMVFIVLFLYTFDFILFDKFKSINSKSKKLPKNLLIWGIGFSEVFFTPFYIRFVNSSSCHKLSRKSYLIIKNTHFFLILLIIIIFLSPLNSQYINNMDELININSYGIVISEKLSKLFFIESKTDIRSMPIDVDNISFKLFYSDFGSDRIEINDFREELYVTSRKDIDLKIIDINNYSIKGSIKSDFFEPNDFRMESSEDFLFIIDDYFRFVYKIDLHNYKIIKKNRMVGSDNSEIIYNKNKDVLYAGEWRDRPYKGNNSVLYFIYEIDGQTLNLLREIPVPSPTWNMIISKDGNKLYCAFPFESFLHSLVYVFDTKSFDIIDKIDVPLGTRAIALDEERQLLFAGSAATNLIDMIDLKTKKTIKTYKAGDYSLREIVIDKKRRNFYVSTQHFGLFKGTY